MADQDAIDSLRSRLKTLNPGAEMVQASLRYVASHPVHPCVIPGAKSPAQAEANARAGEEAMGEAERAALAALAG